MGKWGGAEEGTGWLLCLLGKWLLPQLQFCIHTQHSLFHQLLPVYLQPVEALSPLLHHHPRSLSREGPRQAVEMGSWTFLEEVMASPPSHLEGTHDYLNSKLKRLRLRSRLNA